MHVDLTTLKSALIIVIFLSGIIGVLSPRLFNPFGSRLSYASLLSSGVLMAAAMVHLLGDAAEGLQDSPLPTTASGDPFPWAYLFCAASFYFLYFFERFVLHSLAHTSAHPPHHAHIANGGDESPRHDTHQPASKQGLVDLNPQQIHRRSQLFSSSPELLPKDATLIDRNAISSEDDERDDSHSHSAPPDQLVLPATNGNIQGSSFSSLSGPPIPVHSGSLKPTKPGKKFPTPKPLKMDDSPGPFVFRAPDSPQMEASPQPSTHDMDYLELDDMDEHGAEMFLLLVKKNYMTGIVLLIGLGLHSFLAGVALGSSQQETQAVALGIAIISHKYLAAFALGVPLYKSGMSVCPSLGVALLFASFTPMGIAVGWILAKSFEGWVGDMFVSIASGTFLYVSICEVLVPEFSKEKKEEKITYKMEESRREMSRSGTPRLEASQRLRSLKYQFKLDEQRKAKRQEMLKSLAVIVGFAAMSLLAVWV